jgi:hypothetical protein
MRTRLVITSFVLASACALAACGPSSRGDHGGDGGMGSGATLDVEPANATVTVINGTAQTQAYTVTEVAPDGKRTDVTAQATLMPGNDAFGAFSAAVFTPSGAAGQTTVMATVPDGATGTATLTVMVQGYRVAGTAPANSPTLFGSATETAALAPAIVYPADSILVPPNLGAFDVHWTDAGGAAGDNVFAVEMTNSFIDYTVYTSGSAGVLAGGLWDAFTPAEWTNIASTAKPLTLTVAGLSTATPTEKGTSAAQSVDVTTQEMLGGVYYWTTSSPQGVFRYDMSAPSTPAAPYFQPSMNPGGPNNCMGCHALSHDGTKFALTIDEAGGRGTVINVADGTVLVPYATNPQYWDFATFNVDGTKLVTDQSDAGSAEAPGEGTMVLRDTNGGTILATLPNSPGKFATHPEMSDDGTMLVNVEASAADDLEPDTGAIVTRTFDDATNTFGSINTVLADGVDGLSSYYPSWSPDGQWLLLTRVSGVAYANIAATVWVIKADGSMPPIQLATADLATPDIDDSWARWAPFAQTSSEGEQVYFFTFSSQRSFGVRIENTDCAEGEGVCTPQIWMAPFYPSLAAQGMDPSGPAFWLPFQDVTTHNHIAQWTQQIVVID